jgi:hypothetical protein
VSDTHTLIIKGDAEAPTDADLFDYEVHCPGVTDACRLWVGCEVPECPGSTGGDDTLYDVSDVAHGQKHRYINDSWMVPTDGCYLVAADEMPDAAAFLVTKADLGAGEYKIGHDFDDGRIADFQLIEKVPA